MVACAVSLFCDGCSHAAVAGTVLQHFLRRHVQCSIHDQGQHDLLMSARVLPTMQSALVPSTQLPFILLSA